MVADLVPLFLGGVSCLIRAKAPRGGVFDRVFLTAPEASLLAAASLSGCEGPLVSLKAAGAGTIKAGGLEGGIGEAWGTGEEGGGVPCRLWERVAGGVRGLTGGEAAHDLLVWGESLGLRVGPESASSLLSRPSLRSASM